MLRTCMSPMMNDAGTQKLKGGIKRMEYINIKSFSKRMIWGGGDKRRERRVRDGEEVGETDKREMTEKQRE